MQRVLYLSRGGDIGGSQRQLYHVLTNLDRANFEPIVVCRKDGESVDDLRKAGVETHVLPLRPWRSFPVGILRYADAWRLGAFARRRGVSLIHSSDLWLSGYLRFAARHIGIPSVLHVRAPLSAQCIAKHGCKNVDSLIAISRRVKNNLLDAGIGAEKITVINDSVDVEAFAAAASGANTLRREFGGEGLYVGIVGRIDGFKRQLDFVRAAKSVLLEHGKKATFFIVGNVHSENYYQEVVDFVNINNLGGGVIFTGAREDMPQVLGSLDILVSLSGGSVMFEAMAAGKPVISAGFSTKATSVHIQDGRTGVLIESKSDEELVRGMVRLMDSVDLRRYLGQEAQKWAVDNLSSANMAMRTQMLYEKVLTRYRERPRAMPTPVPQAGTAG